MEPFDISWPGSADRVTVSLLTRVADDIYPAAEYLAARFQSYWPAAQHVAGGPFLSVDQESKWRARMGDAFIAGGVALAARHTSSNGRIIAVAIAEPVQGEQVSRLVIQTRGGYEAATVDGVLLAALKKECARLGAPLAKPRTVWDLV